MSKRARFWLFTLGAFIVCSAIVLITANSLGADPFHPRSRHIWLLSLVAAFYASIRIAMIAQKIVRWETPGEDGHPVFAGFRLFGRKQHAIDRRMEARRARVEAAKSKQDEQTQSDG